MEEDLQLLTLREAATVLRCHPSTIYRLLKNGEIPATRLASDWRFLKSDLVAWVMKNRVNLDALK